MPDKKEIFKEAFHTFNETDPCGNEINDAWMKLFIKFHQTMKQGSGLMWGDIKEIIDNELR